MNPIPHISNELTDLIDSHLATLTQEHRRSGCTIRAPATTTPPWKASLGRSSAKAYSKSDPLQEGILILCKTEKDDKGWYLAEIDKTYPDEIGVTYFSTPRPSLDNYETSSKDQRLETLSEARFRKTWCIRQGKNAGMGTCQAPFPNNLELRLWKGKMPLTEAENLILAIGITLDARGFLSKISLPLESQLDTGLEGLETVEDKEERLCDCAKGRKKFTHKDTKTKKRKTRTT